MKKISFVTAFLLVMICASAQQKPAFHSSIAGGLIVGQQNPSGMVEAINGVRLGKWTAGLGAGIDWYSQRSAPLFLSLQRNFAIKSKEFFVYANGGYNLLWPSKLDEGSKMDRGVIDSRGGLYYDLGIGHQITAFKKHKFFVSVGYTVKQYSEDAQPTYWFDVWNGILPGGREYTPTIYKYDYSLRRINLKVGLRL